MQPLQPLGIADVGLAPGHVLGIAGIDQLHVEATLVEDLVGRDPIDAGRLHHDRLDAACREPVGHPADVVRERAEGAHRFGIMIGAGS